MVSSIPQGWRLGQLPPLLAMALTNMFNFYLCERVADLIHSVGSAQFYINEIKTESGAITTNAVQCKQKIKIILKTTNA